MIPSTLRAAALACRCGDPYDAHQHYRPGCDCSVCLYCDRFTPAHPLRWALASALVACWAVRAFAGALIEHGRPPRGTR